MSTFRIKTEVENLFSKIQNLRKFKILENSKSSKIQNLKKFKILANSKS